MKPTLPTPQEWLEYHAERMREKTLEAWLVTHEELHRKQLAISQKRQQHFDVAMDYIINEKLTTVRSEKE